MLTQADVKKLFDYNPDTGSCTRLTRPSRNVHIGDELGSVHCYSGGLKYRQTEINRTQYGIHRLIWLWVTGEWPENDIDHIDGNGLNNAWSNLREATHIENMRNKKIGANNQSGVVGVSFYAQTKKWRAAINVASGEKKHLGYFDSLEGAKAARLQAEIENGYHENHGREAT